MPTPRVHRWRRLAVVSTAVAGLALPALAVNGSANAAAAPPAPVPVYKNTSYSFAERAADLVSRMTLAEKVQQLHTNNAPAIPRLGVQQYTYWSEGQHGLNRLGADTAEGGQGAVDDVHATSFPTNFASTMSWDPSLVYQETTAISDEARGFLDKSLFGTGQNNIGPSVDDYGDLTYWAPTVNLDRDPRWGRTDEAFGEDPYLVGQMAGAFVNGYQGNTMAGQPTNNYLKVAATAKHYALNNVENNRLSGDSVTTDADLRQYYTKQFATLIEDDHVSGLMTSYNAINGTPSAVNTYTTNQLAERTYGFGGYITSDCDAIDTAWQEPPGGHAWAAPGWTSTQRNGQVIWTNNTNGTTIPAAAGALAYALRAGTQLECTGDSATLPNVQAAIDAKILSVGVIDADLTQLFTMRFSTGEFDPPSINSYTKIKKNVIQDTAHQNLARQVADNSLVLLKDDNVAGTTKPLLPVTAKSVNNVVILGDMANQVTLGDYSGQPTYTTSAVQGITAAVHAANPNATITFDAAGSSSTSTTPVALSDATQAAVKSADLVVVFAGTNTNNSSEGKDRTNLAMPGNYTSLINQVSALGNPRTVLALQSNGPIDLGDIAPKFPAIVFSGYNGQAQGTALADVVFGRQNPGGHLDFTWYQDDAQLPDMQNYGLDPASTGGLGRTYQYFTGTPTYPFGYGLSYSTFAFSNMRVDRNQVSANGTVTVTLDATNTGKRAGTTVAQLYVSAPGAGTGDIPKSQLEGFAKTTKLAPGQTEHLSIPVTISDLALWDNSASKMAVADGTYQFKVGSDASSAAATIPVSVSGAITPKVQSVTVEPSQVVFSAGQTFDLQGKNPWLADDTNPNEQDRNLSITADNVVEAVNNDQSFVDLSSARVKYTSSDTSVATVNGSGIVQAVRDGTATITVTVNGVSGSMPIVVQGTLTDSIPPVMVAGKASPASATFTNGANGAVQNVAVSVAVPAGWTATPTTPTTIARVEGRRSATVTWQVTPPANAATGVYPISFTATSGSYTYTVSGQTNVPYASLAAAYDNTGISDDADTAAGNYDGGGLSFSAQGLAAAGFVSGQPVTVGGVTFTWPATAAPDNIVAGGQAVPLSGKGSTLGILGASNNGTTSGSGTVVYTDGTSQSFALGFADWWNPNPTGGTTTAATVSYLNNPNGQQNQKVGLYYAGISLDASKTVAYVILPDVTENGQVAQVAAMHVFALAVGG